MDVLVFDSTRPTKIPWRWSEQTYIRYQRTHPGRFLIVGGKKLVQEGKIKVEEINQINEQQLKKFKLEDKKVIPKPLKKRVT